MKKNFKQSKENRIRKTAGRAVKTAACALSLMMAFETAAAPVQGYAADIEPSEMKTVTITADELAEMAAGGKYLFSATDGVEDMPAEAVLTEASGTKNGTISAEVIVNVGGYQKAKNPAITKKRAKLFKKAFKGFVGSDVTPVAYLASQVVAGTNHRFLCRMKGVYPGAVETYAFVTIYEDLKGKVSISDLFDTGVETKINELPGGWFQSDSAKLTKDIKKAFKKAMEGIVGVEYKPVALMAYQVVAGMNYCVLCESTVVYPGADTGYALVYFYKGLDGSVKLNDIVNHNTEENGEGTEIGTYEPEHSMNTLLVSVAEDASKKKLKKIFKKLGLSIKYEYDIISGYAVSLAEDTDEDGLNDLIKKLEAYDEIISVEKDYIYHLD